MRSLGQEIVTELTYVSPSFAELIRTPKEALLGTSCTSYLMCDDDEAMRQYFEEMASWVTMRYTLPSGFRLRVRWCVCGMSRHGSVLISLWFVRR